MPRESVGRISETNNTVHKDYDIWTALASHIRAPLS